jgi:hypothetical protein
MFQATHRGARTALNVVWLLFVLFCVVFVCKCVLSPGDNTIAVNKYIIRSSKLYLQPLGYILQQSILIPYIPSFDCITILTIHFNQS